ncbi:hypothetical protein ACGFXC_06480 [Streptomyces sp. NPDC048507]|uniref:hypothetical protein n=1 Tax=Streptomyces sp. NPDC048507 TaxID=3365560 RepID=UPI00371CD3CE
MTLEEGRRVKLAAELRLAGPVVRAHEEPEAAGAPGAAASLSLAAGVEGTVEAVDDGRGEPAGREVLEYVRLKSLLDDFGHQMPPASRAQLADQVGELAPAWTAHQRRRLRVTVRVRLDNGFVLDGAHEDLFTAL